MASKNTTTEEKIVPTTEEKIVPTTEEKRVTIRLPVSREERDDVYVGLNGKGYLIKRGVNVDVPAGVAEILRRREEMLESAFAYEDQLQKESFPGEKV